MGLTEIAHETDIERSRLKNYGEEKEFLTPNIKREKRHFKKKWNRKTGIFFSKTCRFILLRFRDNRDDG